MSRISGISGLSSTQLGAIRRINQLSSAIQKNTTRLTTLKSINSAKDDPSGIIQASLLQMELTAAEETSDGITRANAILSTADAAASEIASLLTDARTLALEAAGGSLSSSEVAANQLEIDTIIASIDSLAGTTFAGRRLLDGSAGYRASGTDTSSVQDVDVLRKSTDEDITVSIEVTTDAQQATDTYSGGDLTEDITLTITGPDGSTSIDLTDGDDATAIAAAFNDVTYLTGVVATVNGSDVDFNTADYGSAATIEIEATSGTFTTDGGNSASGTDAIATINGDTVTGDGATFSINENDFSAIVELDPTASGVNTSFTLTGDGLEFVVGTTVSSTARIGLPNLASHSLGSSIGKLSSIQSGRSNTLTGGFTAEAVQIIDDAIADVTRSQGLIGGFQQYALDSAENVLSSQIENISLALSGVQDADIASETAQLTNNQILLENASIALEFSSLKNEQVLSILQSTVNRLF